MKQISQRTLRGWIVEQVARRVPPARRDGMRKRLRRLAGPAWMGTLRRTTPLSTEWGFDRGTPIDRYYIDQFLSEHQADIRGRVLEIKNSAYTERFGTAVEQREVLDIDSRNPDATIVADLANAYDVPTDAFDCFILTQTLQLIFDTRGAIQHAHRMLRPGGVLLVTVPTISRVVPRYGLETDYWRFTTAACAALFMPVFGERRVTITPYGNVLASTAFLTGMAAEELSRKELAMVDPYFPVIVGVRAEKTVG